MPSKRKQVNVRIDEHQDAVIPRLTAAIEAQQGIAVSVSDLFRMGLVRLEREYLPPAPAPTRPRRKA